jgi:hypothetical protein
MKASAYYHADEQKFTQNIQRYKQNFEMICYLLHSYINDKDIRLFHLHHHTSTMTVEFGSIHALNFGNLPIERFHAGSATASWADDQVGIILVPKCPQAGRPSHEPAPISEHG